MQNIEQNLTQCNTTQNNEAQVLFDFICPKICQYFNDYLFASGSNFSTTQQTSGSTNITLIRIQLISYVNMVVEFYNISQFEAIGVLYDECTLSNGYSYVAGCKVRPNTSIMWQDILGQAPSNEAGLKAPYPEVVEDVNSLSSDLLLDNIVVNTNILIDENLNLSNK